MPFNPKALVLARNAAGLTQAELAHKADVTPNTIWYLESGNRLDPATSTVEKVALALGRPTGFFLDPDSHLTDFGSPIPAAG